VGCCLAAYFPETNVLIPVNAYADMSGTSVSKSGKVRVVKEGFKSIMYLKRKSYGFGEDYIFFIFTE
jgi:hypothetical protein